MQAFETGTTTLMISSMNIYAESRFGRGLVVFRAATVAAQQASNLRQQPGAMVHIFAVGLK